MQICQVLGTVVATQKQPGFRGTKLMLVQRRDMDGKLYGDIFVACDTVGAGTGEIVLVVSGAPARQTDLTKDAPTDAAIVGIVDAVESDGRGRSASIGR